MNKIYLPVIKLKENKFDEIIKESWEIKVRLNQLGIEEPKIISLSGDYGVGKDVWARLICEKSDKFTTVKFADTLRESFNLAGFTNEDIDALKRTNKLITAKVDDYSIEGMTMREALIYVAETNKQRFGQGYYAKRAIQRASELMRDGKYPIFTDLRFDVENKKLVEFARANNLLIDRLHVGSSLPVIVAI